MEIMKEHGKIKKWGNTKGIVLPKAVLSNANLKNKENVNITVETQPNGRKRIVIEDVTEDKKDLLESLVGTVSLPKDFDIKTERAERKQKRLVKHELHH
ncbi:MAG: hypothetical protein L0L57_05540 [Alkalibacterium sp.]|nr:hypothetical protein [Tetragenococcus koreensis]MDN6729618.1 hypothetical protein [Alkalibacterium sp.]